MNSEVIFNLSDTKLRLEEVQLELQEPETWNNQDLQIELQKELSELTYLIESFEKLEELDILIEVLQDSPNDEDLLAEISSLKELLEELELQRMFTNSMDPNDAYLEINAGSGGTEAQDFAEILLRMYLRYCSSQNYKTEIIELTPGDVAGIKSSTIHIKGDYAFGYLRTETGVHRLVRPSPFDSGNRRHTSFASVYVTPEIPETGTEEIKESDLKVDTYKASGKGGQHVNTTDSAVRLTHIPTGIVVACQSERSQHSNKRHAMKQLQSELYLLNERLKKEEQQQIENSKDDITWGSQIRSYVLDDSRVKDLRTNYETRNTQAVLDGDLKQFITRSLKMNL